MYKTRREKPYARPPNGQKPETLVGKLGQVLRSFFSLGNEGEGRDGTVTCDRRDNIDDSGGTEMPASRLCNVSEAQTTGAIESPTELLSELILNPRFKQSKLETFRQLSRFFTAKGTGKLSQYEYDQVAAIIRKHSMATSAPAESEPGVSPTASRMEINLMTKPAVFSARFEYDDDDDKEGLHRKRRMLVPVPVEPRLSLRPKILEPITIPTVLIKAPPNSIEPGEEEAVAKTAEIKDISKIVVPVGKPLPVVPETAPKGPFDFSSTGAAEKKEVKPLFTFTAPLSPIKEAGTERATGEATKSDANVKPFEFPRPVNNTPSEEPKPSFAFTKPVANTSSNEGGVGPFEFPKPNHKSFGETKPFEFPKLVNKPFDDVPRPLELDKGAEEMKGEKTTDATKEERGSSRDATSAAEPKALFGTSSSESKSLFGMATGPRPFAFAALTEQKPSEMPATTETRPSLATAPAEQSPTGTRAFSFGVVEPRPFSFTVPAEQKPLETRPFAFPTPTQSAETKPAGSSPPPTQSSDQKPTLSFAPSAQPPAPKQDQPTASAESKPAFAFGQPSVAGFASSLGGFGTANAFGQTAMVGQNSVLPTNGHPKASAFGQPFAPLFGAATAPVAQPSAPPATSQPPSFSFPTLSGSNQSARPGFSFSQPLSDQPQPKSEAAATMPSFQFPNFSANSQPIESTMTFSMGNNSSPGSSSGGPRKYSTPGVRRRVGHR